MKSNLIMRLIYTAFVAAALGTMASSCNTQPTNARAPETATGTVKVQPVRVMALEYRETAIRQSLTATIEAFEETYLSPALQGRIRSVHVDVNDRVKKGDLLVEMDRTQLDQTRLQYQQLKTDLARMDTLIKHGSVTEQAYDQMKSQLESTGLVLKNLEENTLLRAPHSGIISGKYYNDGELFSPTPNTPAGKAALVSMIQTDPLKVMVNLSEKYLPSVRTGMQATVSTEVYPGEEFQGTVFRIHPTVNAATRTFTVEIRVPNSHQKLRPGMYAMVDLKLGEKEALIVPSVAVLQVSGTNDRYVMIHRDGTAHRVKVQIVDRYDDQLEISAPELREGEQLIFAGQNNLENGDQVRVVE
mgnify:FL=1